MTKVLKMLSIRCLVLSLVGLLAACNSTGPEQGSLVVVSDLENPPFARVDLAGRPAGRDVEMLTEVAKRLGLHLDWKRMPFGELIQLVEAGEADLACATLGISPERAKRVRFSRPYFETEIAVVVRAGEGITEAEQLSAARVYAGAGTTSQVAVAQSIPDAVGVFESEGVPTEELLLEGMVDAAVMDGPNADALVEGSEGRLQRLPTDLARERYALAVDPSQELLAERIDQVLDDMERDGFLLLLDVSHGLVDLEQ